jgi:Mor family transcriptional regulator
MTTRYQQAQKLRRDGHTPKDIAYLTGNIVENVYKLLQYKPATRSWVESRARRAAIAKDYQDGGTTAELVAKYRVSRETVYLARKVHGVPCRQEAGNDY